jgi:hypothetical protein
LFLNETVAAAVFRREACLQSPCDGCALPDNEQKISRKGGGGAGMLRPCLLLQNFGSSPVMARSAQDIDASHADTVPSDTSARQSRWSASTSSDPAKNRIPLWRGVF